MIGGLSFIFANPAILAALVALPVIWWLLRMTPPRPAAEIFPPLRILASVMKREETPSKSPWWLTLLRMLMAAAVIFAIADPVFNPRSNTLATSGPLALLIDNSWATAPDWERRVEAASALIDDAEAKDVAVSIVFTGERQHDATPGSASTARNRLAAARPEPLPADRGSAIAALQAAFEDAPPGTVAFLTDGIEGGDGKTMEALAGIGAAGLKVIEADGSEAVALTATSNESGGMSVTASRLKTDDGRSLPIVASDTRGRAIASGTIDFAPGAATAKGMIEAPFELRNDFARIGIEGAATAGAQHLLDDGFRRRRVALLSGEARDLSQPLLSPLYYINRALAPYADLVEPRQSDLAVAIPELLEQRPSVLIMADIGRLPEETYPLLAKWIDNGGTLIRFAGPRLAAAPADDPLVPVTLRQGERALGGALSWSEPQPLADYPGNSPFAGMARPTDILVKRQVLAEPTADLAERTWANLADGTPLVTTATRGAGRIVLFHVSAEATWSNLPISGHFVEMLRRSVQLSRGGGIASDGKAVKAQTLPPYRLLNADGVLVAETGNARPLDIVPGKAPVATADNPPGLYGSEDGFTALNLLPRDAELKRIDMTTAGPHTSERLAGAESWSLKPALMTLALLLLLADALIVLFMGGVFSRARMARATSAIIMVLAGTFFLAPPQAFADDARPDDQRILERLDTTHLAYVVTGEEEVDRLSEDGLRGLTDFLTYRTTLEPGAPVGLDISKDELSLYPIIYWPISASAPMPSPQAVSRIDAYMRAGGTVLFDTRDQFSSLGSSSTGTSANTERLQAILGNLDIPPLEPVPADHVLTKAFYLLTNFPGRYTGSPLWIESQLDSREEPSNRPARPGDGVTPIIITGNDFAGAWAVDSNGVALLPTVPPDEMQREYAFRSGVNIMMYMLTGNYKADQVHVPALLERLGQ
ncbi:DUF4159 domain-containing protein [Sinorhizobium meliloti]|uniref:DUF4159 domain-containing protein n=1 Tax=Rhizobium meliloti TaxID=382 RepID=UPI000FD5294E|nr:DUF4159 domain-containing protein [Sinorhizobium meliloti]RVN55620.1 DUF4159 domain-containing protein [Sinorhizobium meliloti]RVN68115.1 DUF4159 domain-containing protein [Sinorhizobium meliloti]RVO24846.1 DUF4159 domain-containing protein [Sinorhizobium meliloti]RVO49599.1 DUF4159 domain-containing protein [Sinorhizobium meliloti]